MKTLPIFYEEKPAANVSFDSHGFPELEYNESWQRTGFDISVTLPRAQRKHSGPEVKTFFENILPEGLIRRTLARQIGTDEANVFGLLRHIGRDCAGAFSIGGPGNGGSYEELTMEKLHQLLNELPVYPMGYRARRTSLSLAGAQNKLPLFHKNGVYYLPLDGAASNCILKLPISGFAHTVENEHFCLELAGKIGLPVVSSSILRVNGNSVLHINRYDRSGDGFHPQRIPQEDFCQMAALLSEIKYERDGGPSFADCAKLIRLHSMQPAVDLMLMVKWAAFNLCIGNNDAHAKNISMLRVGNGVRLAPFYDLLTTTYYGNRLLRRMAMRIGGKSQSFYISYRRWCLFADAVNLPHKAVLNMVGTTTRSILKALDEMEVNATQYDIDSAPFSHLAQHIRQRTIQVNEHIKATTPV
mgnify:CR=1 FL=1